VPLKIDIGIFFNDHQSIRTNSGMPMAPLSRQICPIFRAHLPVSIIDKNKVISCAM
jgi:hypothetical protein